MTCEQERTQHNKAYRKYSALAEAYNNDELPVEDFNNAQIEYELATTQFDKAFAAAQGGQ